MALNDAGWSTMKIRKETRRRLGLARVEIMASVAKGKTRRLPETEGEMSLDDVIIYLLRVRDEHAARNNAKNQRCKCPLPKVK